MTVLIGTTDRSKQETTRRVVGVQELTSHTGHVWFEKNDIALLQLDTPVTWTSHVQPACLPGPDDHVPLYSTCFTVGWGWEAWEGEDRVQVLFLVNVSTERLKWHPMFRQCGNHVMANAACSRSQRYTHDSVFWLAHVPVCVMPLRNFPLFVGLNKSRQPMWLLCSGGQSFF